MRRRCDRPLRLAYEGPFFQDVMAPAPSWYCAPGSARPAKVLGSQRTWELHSAEPCWNCRAIPVADDPARSVAVRGAPQWGLTIQAPHRWRRERAARSPPKGGRARERAARLGLYVRVRMRPPHPSRPPGPTDPDGAGCTLPVSHARRGDQGALHRAAPVGARDRPGTERPTSPGPRQGGPAMARSAICFRRSHAFAGQQPGLLGAGDVLAGHRGPEPRMSQVLPRQCDISRLTTK
jgi:hypothetical protein